MGCSVSVRLSEFPSGVVELARPLHELCKEKCWRNGTRAIRIMNAFLGWFRLDSRKAVVMENVLRARRFAFDGEFDYAVDPNDEREKNMRDLNMFMAHDIFLWLCRQHVPHRTLASTLSPDAIMWALALVLRCGLRDQINTPWIQSQYQYPCFRAPTILRFAIYACPSQEEPLISLLRLYPSELDNRDGGLLLDRLPDLDESPAYSLIGCAGSVAVCERLLERIPKAAFSERHLESNATLLMLAVGSFNSTSQSYLNSFSPLRNEPCAIRSYGNLLALLRWCHPDGSWVDVHASLNNATCVQLIFNSYSSDEIMMSAHEERRLQLRLRLIEVLNAQQHYYNTQLPGWLTDVVPVSQLAMLVRDYIMSAPPPQDPLITEWESSRHHYHGESPTIGIF